MGINGLIDVGIVRKLDFYHLRFLIGCDNIQLSYIQDGQLVAQLPFLSHRILQLVGSLESSTHVGVQPDESST
jgi:hypothetical protein